MAKPNTGLTKWFNQKWVNIGAPKKNGKFQKCGTSDKLGYAKCVPLAKATSMSSSERVSAVKRKRATGVPVKGLKGQKPRNVSTFKK